MPSFAARTRVWRKESPLTATVMLRMVAPWIGLDFGLFSPLCAEGG
jgi:hypothetical protein